MILVCGEALIDLVPVAGAREPTYVARPGGSLFNVAVGLGRLGIPTAFLGRLSRDPFGRLLRRTLEADAVDVRYLIEGDEPSALAVVDVAEGAEPIFTFHGEGTADRLLRRDDLPASLPPEVTALQFGSISLVREPGASAYAALMQREHGRRVIGLDPNVRPGLVGDRAAYLARLEGWVALADVVKASRADLAWLHPGRDPEAVAREWLALGPAVVVVTRGSDGAVGLAAVGRVEVPGVPIAVADTVGAGDAFTAGLLAALSDAGILATDAIRRATTDDLEHALAFANASASVACTRPGAQPPARAEVEVMLRR
ncbi:MAG: carbohydrate kinase [Chloroflexi bacterium]|jgi:fructokinase|nr:carbohydrate kinase [Chloroflexota bacterium]